MSHVQSPRVLSNLSVYCPVLLVSTLGWRLLSATTVSPKLHKHHAQWPSHRTITYSHQDSLNTVISDGRPAPAPAAGSHVLAVPGAARQGL